VTPKPWIEILDAPYITGFTGFDRPWERLATHVPDLQVHELVYGAGYIALGHPKLNSTIARVCRPASPGGGRKVDRLNSGPYRRSRPTCRPCRAADRGASRI
jgi:hypothetical protein